MEATSFWPSIPVEQELKDYLHHGDTVQVVFQLENTLSTKLIIILEGFQA